MKKRIIGMLLILVLVLSVCAVSAVGVSAADDTAYIKIAGKTYSAKVGDYLEYRVDFAYKGNKLATGQVELPVDLVGLSGYTQKEIGIHINRIAPATASGSVVQRFDDSSDLNGYVMNFVSASGYDFSSKKTVLSLIFCVEKAGTYDLAAKVRYVDDVKDKTVVDGKYQVQDSAFSFSESLIKAQFDTPNVTAATAAGGIRISWDPVPRAPLYRVYFKYGNSWVKLTDTTDTSVLDTKVKHGSRYTYTVRCLNRDATATLSDYDHTGKSAVYYIAPTLKLSNVESGVSIKWDAVQGASGYRVYYRTSSGWKKLADTAGTSLIDTVVNSGKRYIYTIRTLDISGNLLSGYYTDGFPITYIAAPSFRLDNAFGGIQISWDKVNGAEKYRVFYNGANGWTKLTDTTATSFVDTIVSPGKSYTYTVRCINANGTAYTSDYHAGKSITYYEAPKLTLSNAEDGVAIKWSALSSAAKYRVYYRGGTGWKLLEETAKTSVIDKVVRSGASYTYTIRALDSKGNFITSYDPNGFRIQFIQAPVVSLSNAPNGVRISWTKMDGAEKYRVFYSGAKGWTKLMDTTGNSLVDTVVRSGKSYTYTVRCINTDGTAYTSDYRSGKSIKFYAAPELTLSSTANGVSIKWNAVPDAAKYRVYYKASTGWKKLTDTASTSCVDTVVNNGKTYIYTIRALDKNDNFLTSYYADGFKITYQKQ